MNPKWIFTYSIIISVYLGWFGSAFAGQTISFVLPSRVLVEIAEAAFDKADFKVLGCGESDERCLINGQMPFRSDFRIPKTYVKMISVLFNDHYYSFDVTNMYDAWGNRPLEIKGLVRYFGGKCHDAYN